jgi:hypothetical protein
MSTNTLTFSLTQSLLKREKMFYFIYYTPICVFVLKLFELNSYSQITNICEVIIRDYKIYIILLQNIEPFHV